jgi:hypothetical protein
MGGSMMLLKPPFRRGEEATVVALEEVVDGEVRDRVGPRRQKRKVGVIFARLRTLWKTL